MHVNPPSFVERLRHFGDWSIFLIIKCKQQFVSTLVLRHNEVGETGLKWALNLIWARSITCFHLQHILN